MLVTAVLGLAALFVIWGVSRTGHAKNRLAVTVLFERHPRATPAQERAVARLLEADPFVKRWLFEPGLNTLAMGKHQLPADVPSDSIIVTATTPEQTGEIASRVRALPGVALASD